MSVSYSGERRDFPGTESREHTSLLTVPVPYPPNTANRPAVSSHRFKALLVLLLSAKLLFFHFKTVKPNDQQVVRFISNLIL